MSNPRSISGSVREGTRVVLREITASLHNSPPLQPPRCKSVSDNSLQKTAEHEVKVRFAREFADVGSVTYSAPESLSSASSFQSLTSSLSTKSSSGICPDSVPQSPNQVTDTSYLNNSIHGVEDLILGCATIRLSSEEDQNHSFNELQTAQDISQDQSFSSAIGPELTRELIKDISPLSSDNILQGVEESSSRRSSLVNRLHDVEERPILIVPNALVVEEPTKEPVFPKESDDLISSPQISSLTNIEELPLSQHSGEGSSLNSTICLSAVKEDPSYSKPEEHIAQENTEVKAELLSVNVIPSSAVDSVDSVSALIEHAEGPSLPSISAVSLLSLTGSTKLNESETCEVGEDVKSLLVRSSSPINGTNEGAITLSQNVLKSPDQDIQDIHSSQAESISPSFYDATDGGESRAVLLNDTPLSTLKTLKLEEHLEINVPKGNECSETFGSDVELSSKVDSLKVDVSPLATKETVDDNKSVFLSAQGTNIIEEANAINAAKQIELEETEEQSFEEKLDKTLTFQDNSLKLDSVQEIEQYTDFKPQRQSTTLALPVEQPNFDELKAAAEQIADDIFKTSLEFSEDNDCFITATPDIFQDPTSFDFLINHGNKKTINRLRNESLYVKFDPLVTDTSMLPQGNSPPMNEEQNGKTESTPPNIVTPKRNPAIAAIDRLLFYSPLCTSMTQKMEEPLEKIKPTTEEPKSDAPLVNDINMSKELELVRATVLQLEEELEKQKKEYEAELERQKNSFQEKINKLQAQIAQEVKSKSEMTVVIGEYERSISRMLTEVERDRTTFEQEKTKVQEELHTTNVHLTNTEAAFNDVHQKYERLKGVVTVYKNNEAVLKESIQENLETIKSLETRYDNLKNHALIQLENANLELDTMRKQHQDETVKLHAMVRKAELKSNSLAELVEQKTKENKELAQILDEVIARVGHQNAE
ncbi:uncharacterized protein LOC128886484 [Hylaeus anthracinus]|uniref:uncharacterized protein LOC128886484 n=1 Tax=Hylaeus anthracinus TaxID=313031 RepID=UPI0023B8AACE|nr:uncharacterized protein LOC128886484 [Hylaeus anthracinus]